MPPVQELIKQNLKKFGIEPFGITMPVISKRWINNNNANVAPSIVNVSEPDLSLSSTTRWLAPMAGQMTRITGSGNFKAPVTLLKADGSAHTGQGILITLHPQAYLRLCRLYANLFETETTFNPLRPKGYALRPVPKYFFYSELIWSGTNIQNGGQVSPSEDFSNGLGTVPSELTIHDENGWIIDPLAVTTAFTALINAHGILDFKSGDPDQLSSISGLRTTSSFRVRLVNTNGSPHDGTHLMGNLSTVGGQPASGIFLVNDFTGSDTTVFKEILRDAGTGNSGAFPDTVANRMLIGLSTYGRLSNRVRIPKLPSSTTLTHDFFTIHVVELTSWLTGKPDPAFNGTKLEPTPEVRINEVMHLLADGNSFMGRLNEVFTGSPDQGLLVGETISNDFLLPPDSTDVRWPDFPAFSGTPENQDFPFNLREQLIRDSAASFVDSGETHHVDVLLTLTGVPAGAAVSVFHRKLGRDFVEERGDGAGGVVTGKEAPADGRTYNGTIRLVLPDPLGLRNPDGTFTAAGNPKLNVDVVIVRNDRAKRIFGNIQLDIDPGLVPAPEDTTDNGLLSVPERGIAHSGIHGLESGSADLGSSPGFNDLLNAALQLMGETHPLGRDAPRLPLMARRDALAASLTGTTWKGVLSGGRITKQLHSADSRQGSPGSKGGKETRNVGFFSQNGRLAYDIARHTFRRTESIYTRLPGLASGDWDLPDAPDALASGDPQDANSGPFAGAILQNIAPFCETPELALLKTVVENNIGSIPVNFDALVTWLTGQINGINTSSLPTELANALNKLKTEVVNWLNTNRPTLSDTLKGRVYDELIRELSASCFGRRDSQWALEEGIKSARHFIYIETPGFGPTKYGTSPASYTRDLLDLIKTQIENRPGLHVMICVPKSSEYAIGYSEFLRRELFERFSIFAPTVIDGSGSGGTGSGGTSITTPVFDNQRVVVFHPMGFPGRPSFLENQVVIVDDLWMLLGSSSFRRRGLAFDGSTDLVMTAYDTEAGVSPVIRDFRKSLLRNHLALESSNKTSLKGSNTARIDDGREAFYVIREMLKADGYGLIERLWDGKDPHVDFIAPNVSENLWNPEGQTFNAGLASLVNWLLSSGHSGTTFHDV